MAENSSIEWTDHTQNWWIGCTEVSPACDLCYARTMSERYGWATWGNHPRHRTSESNWRKPLAWNKRAREPGVRKRVFTNSLSDFFDNQVDPSWRADAWAIIAQCKSLDWQILTKRPQNILKMLPEGWGNGWPNVWLGTTVENQQVADRCIQPLVEIPAAIRFLSCEPLLGPVELRTPALIGLDLIIAGGESGARARPSDLVWFRSLRAQCTVAGVFFFMKQITERGKKVPFDAWPEDLRVREMP
jgi:protein gp37